MKNPFTPLLTSPTFPFPADRPLWESSGDMTVGDALLEAQRRWGRGGFVRIIACGPDLPTRAEQEAAQRTLLALTDQRPKYPDETNLPPGITYGEFLKLRREWEETTSDWDDKMRKATTIAHPFRYVVGRDFGWVPPTECVGHSWEDAFAQAEKLSWTNPK